MKAPRAPQTTTKSFSEVKPGQTGCVLGFKSVDECAKRLEEMGLCEGTQFRIIKEAPMGGPVEVEFRKCRLCLRRSEMDQIEVAVDE